MIKTPRSPETLKRHWPCPSCGKKPMSRYFPNRAHKPAICKDCQLDADKFRLGMDTLRRMPTRDGLPYQWLSAVLAARRIRSVASGNGPCSPERLPDVAE